MVLEYLQNKTVCSATSVYEVKSTENALKRNPFFLCPPLPYHPTSPLTISQFLEYCHILPVKTIEANFVFHLILPGRAGEVWCFSVFLWRLSHCLGGSPDNWLTWDCHRLIKLTGAPRLCKRAHVFTRPLPSYSLHPLCITFCTAIPPLHTRHTSTRCLHCWCWFSHLIVHLCWL